MANIAECVLIVEKDFERLAPYIKKVNNLGKLPAFAGIDRLVEESYVEGEPYKVKLSDGHEYTEYGIPSVWSATRNNIKIDYHEMCKYGEKVHEGLRIFSTDDIRIVERNGVEYILVCFTSAWGFPHLIEDLLAKSDLDYQFGVVENGCCVEEIFGSDLGLQIDIEETDIPEDEGIYKYVGYSDDLVAETRKDKVA